jgi:hypothetical protein
MSTTPDVTVLERLAGAVIDRIAHPHPPAPPPGKKTELSKNMENFTSVKPHDLVYPDRLFLQVVRAVHGPAVPHSAVLIPVRVTIDTIASDPFGLQATFPSSGGHRTGM